MGVNVECDTQTVFARAKKRARCTGRIVPAEDIQQSIDEVPESVRHLQGLADLVVHIDNSAEHSVLQHEQGPRLKQIRWNFIGDVQGKAPLLVDDPPLEMLNDVWTGKILKSLPSK